MDKNFNYLFNDVPIYIKEKFQVFSLKEDMYNLNKSQLNNFLNYIIPKNNKVIAKCTQCKQMFPFDVNFEIMHFNNGKKYTNNIFLLTKERKNVFSGRIELNGLISGIEPPYSKDDINTCISYIVYNCSCTNDNNHNYYMMLSVEFKEGCFTVKKIGQNPSMLALKGYDFDKYKKQLKDLNAYDDYKNADISCSFKLYSGAFTYLRRIFEKMVNMYLPTNIKEDEKMNIKIEATKECFDPRIKDILKNMYSILSVSIHELDEEISKDYYEQLKAIIDIQLEFIKTEEDKNKQTKELHNILSRITYDIVSK